MRRVSVVIVAAAVLATGAVLSACGSAAPGNGATTITLYNGQHEQTADNLISAFEQKTGIHVVVRSDDEDVLADQIAAEGSRSPADVFFTENSPPLESLQAKGMLAAVTPATLAQTPAKYNSPHGDWVGVSARVSVIIYNPSLISASQLPSHVSQLADPQYKGKLALAPGETDFQPIVTAYGRAYGTAATLTWLEKLRANAAGHIYPDNETIADEVNRGAAAFGIVNQYYWYRMRAEIGAGNMHSKIT
ncbi:MAG TPA: extracellular solute-binding protein, partial [Streptosporangiaceae bacterium]|nr:extracellular solute-binding protein [Streptosporangiaceae bacterium]